jgi:hypothetical protein
VKQLLIHRLEQALLSPYQGTSETLVRLSPLSTAAITGLFYQPLLTDAGDYGAIGARTRGKRAPPPHCPPQIPHDHTRARNQAAAVGSQ